MTTTNYDNMTAADLFDAAVQSTGRLPGVSLTIGESFVLPTVAAPVTSEVGKVTIKYQGDRYEVDFEEGMTVGDAADALQKLTSMSGSLQFSVVSGDEDGEVSEVDVAYELGEGDALIANPRTRELG